MKTSIKFIALLFILISNFIIGQNDNKKFEDIYIYRTAEDFFNKKETLFGKEDLRNANFYDLKNVKYDYLNLKDSNIYGTKDVHIYDGQVVPKGESFKTHEMQYIKMTSGYYRPFCGGNKDYFITSTLNGSGTFDADGYINNDFTTYGNNSEYGTNFIEFWFHNKIKNISTKKIEEILVDDPILMEKYTTEKNETDKKVWRRYKFFIGIKYFKLYVKSHSK